ncbi:MAG: cysteine desulfurase [Candidatus Pacebacteria bacterium]|nr:cysteine desulfurase [Candidatus Paceibacterota bacterium]MCD8563570.1 cysteine desulfurase [Candidatus Paceibacterota bacterium]
MSPLFPFQKPKRIYLDHAAATPVDPRVMKQMQLYWQEYFHNPHALYRESVHVHRDLEDLRDRVARILGTSSTSVFFTGGGTESNNIALQGLVQQYRKNNPEVIPHIITTTIEHEAVFDQVKNLEEQGLITATYIPVSSDGLIDMALLKKSLRPETICVSVIYVHNEIGVIQPMREITQLVRWYKKQQGSHVYPLVHTDAIQAPLYVPIRPDTLGVDMMSFSSAKIYGPKGVGVVYVRNPKLVEPIVFGGGQESGLRSGTPNMPLIAGCVAALEYAVHDQERYATHLKELHDYFHAYLETKNIPDIRHNGSRIFRTHANVNISCAGVMSEELVIRMDARGIMCSSQSACSSDDDTSRIIEALYGKEQDARMGSLRFTFGRSTTKKDLQKTIDVLVEIIHSIRANNQYFS